MLGTPPAFVLSQDQTLKKLYLKRFHASNHFLNHCFWQLTQEFSLAVFAYASNKSINLSKVFCSSLRYSIYKVQCFALLRTLIFYHIEGRLSRCFFIFFRVFSVICVPSSRFSTPFIRQLAYYNALGINCQALFSLFWIYFFHSPRRSNVHNWRTIPERNTQIFEE